jgi:hypothetical protein
VDRGGSKIEIVLVEPSYQVAYQASFEVTYQASFEVTYQASFEVTYQASLGSYQVALAYHLP